MTISDLIEALKDLPPDQKVVEDLIDEEAKNCNRWMLVGIALSALSNFRINCRTNNHFNEDPTNRFANIAGNYANINRTANIVGEFDRINRNGFLNRKEEDNENMSL